VSGTRVDPYMSDGKTETDKMWNKDDLMEVKSVQYHTEEVIERGMGASINARGEVYVRTRGESHSLLLSLKPTSVTPSKTFSGVHSPFSTRILFLQFGHTKGSRICIRCVSNLHLAHLSSNLLLFKGCHPLPSVKLNAKRQALGK